MTVERPDSVEELRELVSSAASDGRKLRLRGGGSKDAIGAPTPGATVVDLRAFSGIIDYDPAELVLTVGAATPLAEVQATIAAAGQRLAFDPYEAEPGTATIGGVVVAGVAGSGRLTGGAPRDHLLGFEAVSGRAERFRAGAKVVKNVTGYDLSKLVAGSWGRLVAVTELTLKVVPAPRMRRTLFLRGLAPAAAVAAMAAALGSSAEVSAAAHLADWEGAPATLLRLDGFPPSVAAREGVLRQALAAYGGLDLLDEDVGEALWQTVRNAEPLPRDGALWRIVVPPSQAPALLTALPGARWLLDWAGGMVWLAADIDPAALRATVASAGGHASLVRADEAMRATVPAFHPQPAPLAALEARVRAAFDPAGVFDTGRF